MHEWTNRSIAGFLIQVWWCWGEVSDGELLLLLDRGWIITLCSFRPARSAGWLAGWLEVVGGSENAGFSVSKNYSDSLSIYLSNSTFPSSFLSVVIPKERPLSSFSNLFPPPLSLRLIPRSLSVRVPFVPFFFLRYLVIYLALSYRTYS